jgi:HSP20 family molecular chaperone IbpA
MTLTLLPLIAAAALAAASELARALPVIVAETPDAVELRIRLPEDVDPGSVEVRLDGTQATVLARDGSGRELRSKVVQLERPAVEEGAVARYEDGWLAVTLQRRSSREASEWPAVSAP